MTYRAAALPGPVTTPVRLAPADEGAPKPARYVWLALATVYVVWSSTYLALLWVVEAMPPLLSGGLRHVTAGALLFAWLRSRGVANPTRRQWLAALPVGIGLLVVGNGFVALAEREVPSGLAAVVCATMPLVTAMLGAAFGDRPTRRELVGLLVGFAGVAVTTAGELRSAPLAIALLVLAPLGWAAGSVAARRLPLAPGAMATSTQMLTGGVATLLAGLASGETLPTAPVPMRAWLALAYLVVFGSLAAFTAYGYLLKNTTPALATSYAYVNPVLAVLLGVFFAGEALGAGTLLGGALVVVGVVLVATAPRAPGGSKVTSR